MSNTLTTTKLAIPKPASTDPANYATATGEIVDYLDAMHSLAARVYRSTAQTIANSTVTAITFDTVTFASAGMWSAGTPTRLTLPRVGRWLVFATGSFAANATGQRQGFLRRNGVTVDQFQLANAGAASNFVNRFPTVVVATATTDYVDFAVSQASGGNLDTVAGDAWTSMSAHFIGGAV